jgi:hypothetical protein
MGWFKWATWRDVPSGGGEGMVNPIEDPVAGPPGGFLASSIDFPHPSLSPAAPAENRSPACTIQVPGVSVGALEQGPPVPAGPAREASKFRQPPFSIPNLCKNCPSRPSPTDFLTLDMDSFRHTGGSPERASLPHALQMTVSSRPPLLSLCAVSKCRPTPPRRAFGRGQPLVSEDPDYHLLLPSTLRATHLEPHAFRQSRPKGKPVSHPVRPSSNHRLHRPIRQCAADPPWKRI